MDCHDVDLALMENRNSAATGLTPPIQEHLRSCDRCWGLVRAMNAPDRPTATSQEELRRLAERLREDLRPVRPLWPAPSILAAFAGIVGAVATLGVGLTGWSAISAMTLLQTASILGALAVSAALLAYSLVLQMSPGSRHRLSPQLVPPALMTLLVFMAAALFQFQHDPQFWTHGWACFSTGALYAFLTAVPFWLLLRRGAILSPRITGAATGLLAGLVGTSILEIHCPNLDLLHILTGHLGVSALGALVGLGIGFACEIAGTRRNSRRAA